MNTEKKSGISRREFIVVSGMGYKAPSDKLKIAGIGVGGMGLSNLNNLTSENIVALCDVNPMSAKAFAAELIKHT